MDQEYSGKVTLDIDSKVLDCIIKCNSRDNRVDLQASFDLSNDQLSELNSLLQRFHKEKSKPINVKYKPINKRPRSDSLEALSNGSRDSPSTNNVCIYRASHFTNKPGLACVKIAENGHRYCAYHITIILAKYKVRSEKRALSKSTSNSNFNEEPDYTGILNDYALPDELKLL